MNTADQAWKDIIYGDGCTSHIGKAGGRQELSLGPGCAHQYIVRNFVAIVKNPKIQKVSFSLQEKVPKILKT